MGYVMFAYSWGCNFLDVVVFRFNRKTKSFIISFLIPTQIIMISHVQLLSVYPFWVIGPKLLKDNFM